MLGNDFGPTSSVYMNAGHSVAGDICGDVEGCFLHLPIFQGWEGECNRPFYARGICEIRSTRPAWSATRLRVLLLLPGSLEKGKAGLDVLQLFCLFYSFELGLKRYPVATHKLWRDPETSGLFLVRIIRDDWASMFVMPDRYNNERAPNAESGTSFLLRTSPGLLTSLRDINSPLFRVDDGVFNVVFNLQVLPSVIHLLAVLPFHNVLSISVMGVLSPVLADFYLSV
ncbi:hypothetical protein E3N88_28528 [Mikania micrantha]|uniref:Uncharacterized protein n=1 Tax=Mikania micrantha TaxID=192012 RepID=A0A5N6N0W1_9ASTR|nr:hypothetical protein E3N88_28528 [Mikania micrantha]